MDIALNKHLDYKSLKRFLDIQFSTIDFFLIYDDTTDWDDIKKEELIIQYFHDEGEEANEDAEFKYGLSLHLNHDNILSIIERLSWQLSDYFNCGAFCDSSRILLKENSPYYSLLFEHGKVYLVDDYIFEDTGNVSKVIELRYDYPEYNLNESI